MLGTLHLNAFSIDTLCPHLNETKVLQISSFKMWHSCQSVWFFVIWHTVCYMNLWHILLSTFITYLILMYAIIVTVISVYITKMEAKLFLQATNLLLTAKKQCILGVQHAIKVLTLLRLGRGLQDPGRMGASFDPGTTWNRNMLKIKVDSLQEWSQDKTNLSFGPILVTFSDANLIKLNCPEDPPPPPPPPPLSLISIPNLNRVKSQE